MSKVNKTNIEQLAQAYHNILSTIGEDVKRDGLQKTPQRAAKAIDFLCSGYATDLDTIVNKAVFESDAEQMVLVKDIEMYSLCEHHLLPFIGKCHIAYLPNKKVLGLSKFARIVDMYARRLQVQENLTRQIALAIQQVTNAHGVGVVIEAKHMCMMMRGVQKQNSSMRSSALLGAMRDKEKTRSEFFALLK